MMFKRTFLLFNSLFYLLAGCFVEHCKPSTMLFLNAFTFTLFFSPNMFKWRTSLTTLTATSAATFKIVLCIRVAVMGFGTASLVTFDVSFHLYLFESIILIFWWSLMRQHIPDHLQLMSTYIVRILTSKITEIETLNYIGQRSRSGSESEGKFYEVTCKKWGIL